MVVFYRMHLIPWLRCISFGCHPQNNRREPLQQVSFRPLPSFQKAPGAAMGSQGRSMTMLNRRRNPGFNMSSCFWRNASQNNLDMFGKLIGELKCIVNNIENSRGRNRNAESIHFSECWRFAITNARSLTHSPTLWLQNGCSHGGVLQNASDPITDMHFLWVSPPK